MAECIGHVLGEPSGRGGVECIWAGWWRWWWLVGGGGGLSSQIAKPASSRPPERGGASRGGDGLYWHSSVLKSTDSKMLLSLQFACVSSRFDSHQT